MEVSDQAAEKLKEFIKEESKEGIKIVAHMSCCGPVYEMGLDGKSEDDEIIEVKGIKFFADKETAELLEGASLTYDESQEGFHIENENSPSSCGSCPGCN